MSEEQPRDAEDKAQDAAGPDSAPTRVAELPKRKGVGGASVAAADSAGRAGPDLRKASAGAPLSTTAVLPDGIEPAGKSADARSEESSQPVEARPELDADDDKPGVVVRDEDLPESQRAPPLPAALVPTPQADRLEAWLAEQDQQEAEQDQQEAEQDQQEEASPDTLRTGMILGVTTVLQHPAGPSEDEASTERAELVVAEEMADDEPTPVPAEDGDIAVQASPKDEQPAPPRLGAFRLSGGMAAAHDAEAEAHKLEAWLAAHLSADAEVASAGRQAQELEAWLATHLSSPSAKAAREGSEAHKLEAWLRSSMAPDRESSPPDSSGTQQFDLAALQAARRKPVLPFSARGSAAPRPPAAFEAVEDLPAPRPGGTAPGVDEAEQPAADGDTLLRWPRPANPLDKTPAISPEPPADKAEAPSAPRIEDQVPPIPVETYAQVKVAVWEEGGSLDEALERFGIDEVRWRVHEARQAAELTSEAGEDKAELALRVCQAIAVARRQASAADDEQQAMPLERYAELRAAIDEGANIDRVLRESGMGRAKWQRERAGWAQRCRQDPKLAREVRLAVARARRACRTASNRRS